MIDPGHGGKDAGAIGPKGTKEKDVALAISKKLVREVRKKTGASVYLTRSGDKYLLLEDRDSFAVSKKADLFISIHANASEKRNMTGIETYYLNNASDKAAERLAARENRASGKKLSDVEHILSTMLQNYDSEESRRLADNVQKSLVRRMSKNYPGVQNRKVRSALFYVLVGAKCPAILVETSFISNPRDEKRLVNGNYQDHLAIAITEGLRGYLKARADHSSSL